MAEIIALHSAHDDSNNTTFFNRCCGNDEQVDPDDVDVQGRGKSRYKTGSFTQLRWLIWRNFVDTLKNPFEIRLRLILAVVCFLIIYIISVFLQFYFF
jgi:hypothetical protein